MTTDSCGICGGDGRIGNSFGLTTRCPACHGTGRRSSDNSLLRDVTKTKPSHHKVASSGKAAAVETGPSTHDGMTLAAEVRASSVTGELKDRLIREIADYEGSHGRCTQTFTKKIRKQIRARVS